MSYKVLQRAFLVIVSRDWISEINESLYIGLYKSVSEYLLRNAMVSILIDGQDRELVE